MNRTSDTDGQKNDTCKEWFQNLIGRNISEVSAWKFGWRCTVSLREYSKEL